MNSADWLRRLHHVAGRQNSLRGLNAVLEVIGEAVGVAGVVLWYEEPGQDGRPRLSPVAQWSAAQWSEAAGSPAPPVPPRCEATILAAFRTGSLALPVTDGPAGGGPAAEGPPPAGPATPAPPPPPPPPPPRAP